MQEWEVAEEKDQKQEERGFLWQLVVKYLSADAGDKGLIPGPYKESLTCHGTTEPMLQSPGTSTINPMCCNY